MGESQKARRWDGGTPSTGQRHPLSGLAVGAAAALAVGAVLGVSNVVRLGVTVDGPWWLAAVGAGLAGAALVVTAVRYRGPLERIWTALVVAAAVAALWFGVGGTFVEPGRARPYGYFLGAAVMAGLGVAGVVAILRWQLRRRRPA